MRFLALLLASRALWALGQYTETSNTLVITTAIDDFVNSILTDWNSPGGVAIAVVKKTGDASWNIETKGYGRAKADNTPVDEDTLFNIASNSKLFTALTAGMLVEDDSLSPRLTWKTKIKSIVPEWQLADPVASDDANLIDLISHRTGLPRHDFGYHATDSLSDHISKYRYQKSSAEFRDTYQYNNNMYALLSYLPTVLLPSHPSLASYVKANIFDPLGMSSTTYSYSVAQTSGKLADGLARQQAPSSTSPFDAGTPRALPYWDQDTTLDGDLIAGAGGIISSAKDMARWLQALLLQGRHPETNAAVIPSAAIQAVSTGYTVNTDQPYASVPLVHPATYGGGSIIRNWREHVIIEHGGAVNGFKSMIARLPHDGFGFAVLTNDHDLGGNIAFAIVSRLTDEALGLTPADSKTSSETFINLAYQFRPQPLPRPSTPAAPSQSLDALAGIYEHLAYGSVELCVIPPPGPPSTHCQDVATAIATELPGTVDPIVPTLFLKWNKQYSKYLRFTHIDADTWNVASFEPFPTGDPNEPWWYTTSAVGTVAEFASDNGNFGFALTGGFWGAGPGVSSPSGSTVKDKAEVWFQKA